MFKAKQSELLRYLDPDQGRAPSRRHLALDISLHGTSSSTLLCVPHTWTLSIISSNNQQTQLAPFSLSLTFIEETLPSWGRGLP